MPSNRYDLEILIRTRKEGDGIQQADRQVENFGKRLNSTLDTINKSAVAVVAAGATFKEAFDLAKEGAQLEFTEDRFVNLAASIGTTADALRGDLKNATGGLVADSQLVASAADFMALGLAKTHDETVRLTRVAGALDADMNQLVLTLTNQTTARFDALGVSVDGFDQRVEGLIATGLSAEEAFTEAFLQQAEEQIERVGSVTDSTSAAYQKFEAQIDNTTDALKRFLAVRNEGVVGGIANTIEAYSDAQTDLNEALERGVITQEEYSNILNYITYGQYTSFVAEARDGLAELDQQAEITAESQALLNEKMEQAEAAASGMSASTRELAQEAAAYDQALLQNYGHLQEAENAERALAEAQAARAAALVKPFNDAADPVQNLLAAQEALAAGEDDALQTVAAAEESIRGEFRKTAAEALLARNGLNEANLQLLVGIGYLTQAEADARLEFANTTTAIEELTASAEFNRLTAEEQTTALNALIDGTAKTADEAVNLAGQQTLVNDALNAMPELVGSTVKINGLEAASRGIGDLLRQMDQLDGRSATASATVNTTTTQDVGSGKGGGGKPPERAAGGAVFDGGLYRVGEGDRPELLQQNGRLYLIPGEDGQVFGNQQSQGMLGGQVINDNRQTVIHANSREAAALAMATVQQERRKQLDTYMGV